MRWHRLEVIAPVVVIAALTAAIPASWPRATARVESGGGAPIPPAASIVAERVGARRRDDFAAMATFRPGYAFWQHVFTLADGSIAYGSATDGRLLAVFPATGDWTRHARWTDAALSRVVAGRKLARRIGDRRDQVAGFLEAAIGPVLHNSTRGDALLQNAGRYGAFLNEWGAIYERFGVPADIGLAQVILESGLDPTRRSEAGAIGFCQWLRRNWTHLNEFSPHPIDGRNQTTQAPYCAAYLTILATKYGSFIPALSEHNAGGTNVGRTLINGERLGAEDVRARYFLGSNLARELRSLPGREYRGLYASYGPRSHLYAEMVFGSTFVVRRLMATAPQAAIHAMRTARALTLAEIITRTGLAADEVRRYNPAAGDRVPARTMLYLPAYVPELGPDIAFWRRPASPQYEAVLADFVSLPADPERWDDPAFAPVLLEFRRRFRETHSEEGLVMDTVLAYATDQAYTSSRRALLAEFRGDRFRRLVERGILELDIVREGGVPRDRPERPARRDARARNRQRASGLDG